MRYAYFFVHYWGIYSTVFLTHFTSASTKLQKMKYKCYNKCFELFIGQATQKHGKLNGENNNP